MIQNKTVTIIIPIFNDYDRLVNCLNGILNQNYNKELIEIIIVDNGSKHFKEKSKEIVNSFPSLNIIFEQEFKVGSYAARNRGIDLSTGEIIVFTDSDCLPEKNWLLNGINTLIKEKDNGIVAGAVNVTFKNPQNPSIFELYDKIDGFPIEKYVKRFKFGVTANLFTYKIVIDRVGSFNSKLKSGGDSEWGRRVYSHGYSLVYGKNAIINHPARNTFKSLKQKVKRVTGGIYDKRMNSNNPHLIVVDILKSFIPPVFKIKELFKNKELNLFTKVQLTFFMIYFKLVQIVEYMKLIMGSSSKRA
ncbi:glycosyltransferase [Niallia circulans]|uniref:glycosyltransferase n=1 Tax=Niallia circulans TaxID=1397 RepID=UPI00203B9A56|nr:glycosyltransferase [Niallia circulans]MCM2983532.1 glycosyltransferase [Niallia circulans]